MESGSIRGVWIYPWSLDLSVESGSVEAGSVVESHLLPPCSCSTPCATITVASPIAIITVIIIINITLDICTIIHCVYGNIAVTACTSVCILCRLLLPIPPLLLSLSLSLYPPTGRGRWPPTLSHGSARGFCLLKGSFSLPLSPSACSWWELLGFCK